MTLQNSTSLSPLITKYDPIPLPEFRSTYAHDRTSFFVLRPPSPVLRLACRHSRKRHPLARLYSSDHLSVHSMRPFTSPIFEPREAPPPLSSFSVRVGARKGNAVLPVQNQKRRLGNNQRISTKRQYDTIQSELQSKSPG